MSNDQIEKPSVRFEREYPPERLGYYLASFFRKPLFRGIAQFYRDERGDISEHAILLKAKEVGWLIKRNIEDQQERDPDYEITYMQTYVYRSIQNILLDELKDEKGFRTVSISEEFLEDIRMEIGDNSITFDPENSDHFQEIVREIPGFRSAIVRGNRIVISERDVRDRLMSHIKRIESLHGVRKPKRVSWDGPERKE